jgi:hypothetical protein
MTEQEEKYYVAITNAAREKGVDLKTMQSYVKQYRSLFWSQVIVPALVVEEQFYEVYDVCEERNMFRFKHGKWLGKTKADFDKFHEWLRSCGQKVNDIVLNYGVQMSKQTEKQVRDLYLTFHIYFERKGQTDIDFKSRVQVTASLIHLAKDLFDMFFDIFNEKCGFDIRDEYKFARLGEADLNFCSFADDVIKPSKYKLSPCKNWASEQAYNKFCEKLLDEKTLDYAGLKAMELSHEDEFLAEMERSKMGLDRLKETFKVTEL